MAPTEASFSLYSELATLVASELATLVAAVPSIVVLVRARTISTAVNQCE
jgi:hypothetical protein